MHKRTEDQKIMYQAIKDAWTERLAGVEIENAINEGVSYYFGTFNIRDQIRKGIEDAMPRPSEVLDVIHAAVKRMPNQKGEDD